MKRQSNLLLTACYLHLLPAARSFSTTPPSLFQNNLQDLSSSSLCNDYFAMRHGQSLANVAEVIASNPKIACYNYGLSGVGKEQANQAGQTVVQQFLNNNKYNGIVILTSDLLRAKETAEIVASAVLREDVRIPFYKDKVIVETRLRERGFGDWDGGSDEHYQDVWKEDAIDPLHQLQNVESVMSVMDRSTSCITEWDARLQNHMIICVAHGDVLQILQTAFSKMDGSEHRSLEHLETATLRRMILA